MGDLEASISWYRDLLGFKLERAVDVPENEGKVGLLRRDGFGLELFCIPGATPLPDERRYPWSDIRTHGFKHVALADGREIANIHRGIVIPTRQHPLRWERTT